jgi:hypothetical protein
MKIAIMQPYLFPYIGYFQLLNSVDKFILHDDVQWIKGGWINRNRILLNGEARLITLSVKKRSAYDLINQFEISEEHNNRIKFLNKIKAAYSKSPFYKKIIPMLEKIILNKESNLAKYIKNSLEELKLYLGIDTPIYFSSSLKKNNKLKGQDRIIEICKVMKATTYINPIGGLTLYDKKIFKTNGITLHFLKPNSIIYSQFNNNFIQNLSIIDVLMFNDKSEVQKMLKEFTLI